MFSGFSGLLQLLPFLKKPVHCAECNDPDYIPPSPEILEILNKAIANHRDEDVVYLDYNFAQHAEDE